MMTLGSLIEQKINKIVEKGENISNSELLDLCTLNLLRDAEEKQGNPDMRGIEGPDNMDKYLFPGKTFGSGEVNPTVLKEIWQQTRSDFIKNEFQHRARDVYAVTINGETFRELPSKVFPNGTVMLDIFGMKYFKPGEYKKINSDHGRITLHEDEVSKAVYSGKVVPEDVLKNYPKLKEKYDLRQEKQPEHPCKPPNGGS